ncbi:MAG TPA: GNAT family N-acetyltransferase [Pyrinomonadaceae bacterium]
MSAATLHTDAAARPPAAAHEIETARLRLRLFRPADLDALCAITSDPEVMRHIGHGHTLTREETRVNLESLIEGFRRRGFGRWALECRETGSFLGYCGLSHRSEEVGVELAYLLARAAWGRGLAQEAGRASLRYAFERLGFGAVAGLTFHDNQRSRRVLERLGMSFVRDAHYYGFDCVQYRLARADWRDDGSPYRVTP